MSTMPKRLAHKVSKRGVDMVLLELPSGQRVWSVDHYSEAQRLAEEPRLKRLHARQEERAWDPEDTFRRLETKKVIANVGKLYR